MYVMMLNDSATCPCDYSLLHVAYTAFMPLINMPKSKIGYQLCDNWSSVICPIIGQPMLSLQPSNNSRYDRINCLVFPDRRCDFINSELQIRSDRHRQSGHINFWDRSDRQSGSINFLNIYGQIADLTVSLSIAKTNIIIASPTW